MGTLKKNNAKHLFQINKNKAHIKRRSIKNKTLENFVASMSQKIQSVLKNKKRFATTY